MTRRLVDETLLEAHLAPIREDIIEIKEILKEDRQQRWLGPRGHELFSSGSVLLAVISILIALFLK